MDFLIQDLKNKISSSASKNYGRNTGVFVWLLLIVLTKLFKLTKKSFRPIRNHFPKNLAKSTQFSCWEKTYLPPPEMPPIHKRTGPKLVRA